MHRSLTVAVLAASLVLPAAARADEAAVKARQSLMTLLSYNLGPLAQMAQGRIEYDADTAQTAADNLVAVTGHALDRLFPEGTAQGEIEGSRALPAVWDDLDEFATRYAALQDAAATMQDAAGDGLTALQGALGPLGGACQACHQPFRASD